MSFLNSIMTTIDGKAVPKTAVPSTGSAPRSVNSVKPVTSDTNGVRPSQTQASDVSNRKLDSSGGTQSLKVPGNLVAATTPSSPLRSKTSSPAPKPTARAPKAPSAAKPAAKSAAQTIKTQRPPVLETSERQEKTTVPAAASAPKKSGYLAMLERAKALQQTAKPVGQIKHHKVEKSRLSRREKERLAAEAATGKKDSKRSAGMVAGAGSSRAGTPTNGRPSEAKKKVEVAYKGTMRNVAPTQPAYRGTMGGGGAAAPRGRGPPTGAPRSNGPGRHRAQVYDDEDEDEDEDEDMDDYDSASSDMEAGRDDLDEEELLSAAQAKREDAEAMRLEAELKKQKLERKRKLEALSAAASKKKKVY